MSRLFANYNRLPVNFVSGKGSVLTDDQGREFLDFLSGIAVNSLGHAHPEMVTALQDQVSKLTHVSNLYGISEQEKAGRRLTELCQMERAIFCNSGAEANEILIKLARRHAWKNGLNSNIVVCRHSFHGRSMGTVSATGTPKYQEGFHPLLPGFIFVDFNDLEQAEAALQSACAILVEPVQGEGGVIPATPEYLKGLRELTASAKQLLLLDEVQTGIGRTGHWLAAQHFGVQPDAVALAKGLGGGVPVGGVLATEALSVMLPPGTHGSTFAGNPLAMRAVNVVLDVLSDSGTLKSVNQKGLRLAKGLKNLPGVEAVRGLGLMLAAQTTLPAAEVTKSCLAAGLLVNAVRPNFVRMLPPLTITEQEIDLALSILETSLCPKTANLAAASAPS